MHVWVWIDLQGKVDYKSVSKLGQQANVWGRSEWVTDSFNPVASFGAMTLPLRPSLFLSDSICAFFYAPSASPMSAVHEVYEEATCVPLKCICCLNAYSHVYVHVAHRPKESKHTVRQVFPMNHCKVAWEEAEFICWNAQRKWYGDTDTYLQPLSWVHTHSHSFYLSAIGYLSSEGKGEG